MSKVICATCGAECVPTGCTSGYGVDSEGAKHCFQCCGARDAEEMRATGRALLYLSCETPLRSSVPLQGTARITNWPGTLSIPVGYIKQGQHNIAGTRYDVWFSFEGQSWHGVQYGENTQLCHCRRVGKSA